MWWTQGDLDMNIPNLINRLPQLSTAELAAEYERLYGRKPRYRNPVWMRKRIAYQVQVAAYGGLSGPARAELERLAADIQLPDAPTRANVREHKPKKPKGHLRAGTTLQREWHGTSIRVEVLPDGFVYEGTHFKSLSAVAKHVTGQHWSGPRFFGLTRRSKS